MHLDKGLQHIVTAVVFCSLAQVSAATGTKPLWEVGLGVGAFSFPDYRGSDEQEFYAFPVPYFVYRGDIFKADRDGIRSILFDTDRVQLNVSLGASLPVDSENNDARRGMPDLQPTVEVGPSVEINFWRSEDRKRRLDLRLPLRMGITLESSPRDVGWIFSPRLNLDFEDSFGFDGWNLGVLAGLVFNDRRNNAYFYDVAPQYVTTSRPEYRSEGGYGGSQFVAAISKRYPRFWIGSFVRYDSIDGAVFEDSPLVRSDSNWAAGFAIAWVLAESSQLVDGKY